MTKDQIRIQLRQTFSDYFDGYILVGKVAGSTDVVIDAIPGDLDSRVSLIIGLNGLLTCEEFRNPPPQ